MQIWTFWEPKDKIPYYLQLCMRTWTKFLPDANVTVLDFSNIQNFINISDFGENLLSGRFTLPQIADAIRVMLLEKYGGIWLDVDTVILDRAAKNFFDADKNYSLTAFGNIQRQSVRICFLNAKAHSNLLKSWLEFVKNRVKSLEPTTQVTWDYLGNAFVDDYLKSHPDEIKLLDNDCVHPEYEFLPHLSEYSNSYLRAYVEYYFLQSRHIEDVSESMLLLHNSWTPAPVKTMGEKDFLRCNFTLANILMAALNLKRDLKNSPINFVAG